MYTLLPKIVLSDTPTALTLRPGPDDAPLDSAREYEIRFYAMDSTAAEHSAQPVAFGVRPQEGALRFHHTFAGEQEHRLLVFGADPDNEPEGRASLYSVAEDLFVRRPFKGDTHQHSTYSDGADSPAVLAAYNRQIGMDFAAITDHRAYAPSLEAIAAFAGVPHDLRLYPGEEVHPPESLVHFVNFGGASSVNDLFAAPSYQEEVDALIATLPDVPADVSPYIYASSLWTLAKIQEAGGIAIFCHPYWICREQYNVGEGLLARLFRDQPFDAYELIGGFAPHETESNALQIARYYEEYSHGRVLPIVGASDGHGIAKGLHSWYYTVALAPSVELEDLRAAVRDRYTVAVEFLPGSPAARAWGPFRLVKYVSFLLREAFPEHDALCLEEGRWMADYLGGDEPAVVHLTRAHGRTRALYDRLWGQT